MKLINLGVNVKHPQFNKNIKEIKPVTSVQNKQIQNELAVPSAKLLQTYNGVSFKGDTSQNFDFSALTAKPNYQVYRTMLPAFDSFQKGMMKNQKFAGLFAGYTVDEIVTLFDEVIENQQEQNFSKLVNAGKNLPELSRNLSFKEAKDLSINGITRNADIQNYLTLVKNNYYSPEIALSAIKYGLSQKDIIRLEELSNELFNANRRLTQEEAVTCLAYDFDKKGQIQSFIDRLEKDYAGNRLVLFDAALCTVHNLNDTETKKFLELKSKQLPYKKEDGTEAVYTLSSQEAILCTKAELNDDELNRYAELKNKPYIYSAVRDNSSSKEPSSELIISFIKDKQTDEKIGVLGKYGFQSDSQYEDYKAILSIFGYNLPYSYNLFSNEYRLANIAKLQDENGKNIFKAEDGNFNFRNFDLKALMEISDNGLTVSQVYDFSRILLALNSLPNVNDENLARIAARLAKLQDENGQNLFENEQGKFNFENLDLNSLYNISYYKLTKDEINDCSEILSILNTKSKEPMSQGSLAVDFARMPDDVKNTYRNSDGKFNLDDYDLNLIVKITWNKFTREQVEQYSEFLNCLRRMPNEEKLDLVDIAAKLAMLPSEIRDTYKDKQGNIDFSKFNLHTLYKISSNKFTLPQVNDYSNILAVLKTKPPKKGYDVDSIATSIAKFSDELKNEFKDDKNQFNFDRYDIEVLFGLISYNLTASQIQDFNQILPIISTMQNNTEFEIHTIATRLAALQNENGENIFKDTNGQFDFGDFDLQSLWSIASYNLNSSQISDFSKIKDKISSSYTPYKKVTDIAAFLAKLSEEEKVSFKNETGEFDFSKYIPINLEKCSNYKLSPNEYIDFSMLVAGLHCLAFGAVYSEDNTNTISLAIDLAKCKDKNGKNIFIDENNNLQFGNLDIISIEIATSFTQKECENYRYLTSTLGIAPENAIYIAQDEELMERFKLVNPNIFWEGATGELKETFELFDSVLCSNNINGNRIKESDFDTELSEDYSFNFGTLRFAPADVTKQSFSVSLQKATKESSPILIAKNQGGEKETYIAYDGAIALLRELRTLTQDEEGTLKEGLSAHSHFSTEEINALSEAARHFIIDIIQENGECIISKGIDGIEKAEPFIGKELDTDTTKEKFKEILQKLHNDSSSPNITIENILRLIPKDAIIQIRPYTTNYKASHEILYSISSEWRDSEGKKWDLRVHSEDLKHIGKSWIYRLGYQDLVTGAGSLEPLYYDNNQNDFVRGSTNPTTHVKIDSGLDDYKNKLISNPYFQEIIRKISTSFNKIQKIDAIASELDIHTADKKQKQDEIIAKCQQDAGYYYKYKKVVDNLLKEKGFLPFSSVA